MRLSNFLIWQAAYAEFYSTHTTWPDFDKESFYEALAEYSRRNRKFGGILPEELHEYKEDGNGANGAANIPSAETAAPLDHAAVN
jgi:hypothetical protein